MCVIFHFTPGSSLNKEQFFNAVHNNWHGYGLVLVDGNKHCQLLKGFSEEGTNPETLWKLIEDNNDIDRYLHIRHSTRGGTDESNVQPFQVYNGGGREVFFMHNGTLGYSFGSHTTGKSDTLDFCEKILQPALLRWTGENGKGDYTDEEFYRLIIDKQWVDSSTGLFVSNNLPPRRIGKNWSQYKHPDDTSNGTVWVSNTLYFEKVSRGPRFLELCELERKRKAAEEAAKTNGTAGVSSNQKAVREVSEDGHPFWEDLQDENSMLSMGYGPTSTTGTGGTNGSRVVHVSSAVEVKKWSEGNAAKSPKILKALTDITDIWNLDDIDDVRKLNAVTYDEWYEFIEDEGPWTIAALLDHMSDVVNRLSVHNKFLTRTKHRAEGRIRELIAKVEEEQEKNKNGEEKAA